MKKLLSLLCSGALVLSVASAVSAETSDGITVHENINDFYLQKYGAYIEPYNSADTLFDGDLSTNWYAGDQWGFVIWEMPEAVSVSGYQLVSADDTADDPVHTPFTWILFGANDYDSETSDGTWHIISEVTENPALTEGNSAVCTVTLPETAPAYKYYQLEICDMTSAGFKLAECHLLIDEPKSSPQTFDPAVFTVCVSTLALAGCTLLKKK